MKRHSASLVIVSTTVASKAEAQRLARLMIQSRLAACAQFTPLHSVYRWKGNVESAPEYLLMAKTRAALATDLMAFIKIHHPYEVPEILVTPVMAAFEKYREWVEEETNGISSIAGTHGKKK